MITIIALCAFLCFSGMGMLDIPRDAMAAICIVSGIEFALEGAACFYFAHLIDMEVRDIRREIEELKKEGGEG